MGSASYITRANIEKWRSARTSDVLRRASSVTIIDSAGVPLPASRRGTKVTVGGGGIDVVPCVLQTVVDGTPKEWGFAVNNIPPETIHGIEVYPGPATIPAEYAGLKRDGYCGLIMIWTRRDKRDRGIRTPVPTLGVRLSSQSLTVAAVAMPTIAEPVTSLAQC